MSEHVEIARLTRAFEKARIRAWYWAAESRLTQYLPTLGDASDSSGDSDREHPFTEVQLLENIHPDDRERVGSAWNRAFGEHEPYEIEYRRVITGERVRHQHEIGSPEFDGSGRYLGHFGTTQDITERHEAEEALRESETRTRLIADNLPAVIVYFDAEERFQFANETWASWYRRPLSDIAGTRIADIVGASRYERLRPHITAALAGKAQSFAESVETPDGEHRETEVGYVPHLAADGTVAGVFAMAQDVTGRKRAEDALRARELEFRSVMDNSPAAVFLKDTEGRFLQVNRRFEEWYGRAAADVLGKTAYDIHPKEDAEAHTTQDREVLEGMRVVEREHQIAFADGKLRDIRVTKFPVIDTAGAFRGVATFDTDITEYKRTADQLRQAQKMEAVGQLTGGVAHDFNNLLAVILGNAELAESQFGDRGLLSDYLATVSRAADRGAELTQRLLAFSRQQALRPKKVDIAALAGSMTALLRRTLGETITIETRAGADIWAVEADPGQLEAAVLNLAINARDAMPGGGRLTIAARNARIGRHAAGTGPDLAPGDYVVLAVGDTGEGMPADVVKRAFDPFFTTKEVGKGSGLGLSMVYGFVIQSGGNVEIESEAGHGTTVRIFLPKAEGRLPREEKGAPGDKPTRGRGETILVVEDDAAVRRLVVKILGSLGYRTIEAENGRCALALLDETPEVDLLFSDMVLPGGMTGLDIAEQARRARPDIKILFMSGYTESGAELANVDVELIAKPFKRAVVAEKVRAVLDR